LLTGFLLLRIRFSSVTNVSVTARKRCARRQTSGVLTADEGRGMGEGRDLRPRVIKLIIPLFLIVERLKE